MAGQRPIPFRSIPLIEVRSPLAVQRVAPPAVWLFAATMAASLALAAGGGVVLGILAATQTSAARTRWLEIMQAHGDIQLWGWVGPFVVALVFEFIVRLNRRPPFSVAARLMIVMFLIVGAVVSASGRVIGRWEQPLTVGGSSLIMMGCVAFAYLILRTRPARPLTIDLHPLFFRAGAVWLVLAAVAVLAASIRMHAGVLSLAESRLVVECFLRGFVMNIIVAVGLRAFPGHLGLPEVGMASQRALWILVNGSLLISIAGTTGFGLTGVDALRRGGDIAFAVATLWATRSYEIGSLVRRWGPSSERYQVMIPVAWIGLVAYAAALSVQALTGWQGGSDLPLLEAGAVRHILMLGFIAPLLIAMAHVVLDRFGMGHVLWRNVLTAAFVLLIVAWPLRSLPPLADPSLGDAAQAAMGTAGILTALALAIAAGVAARNTFAIARQQRQLRAR